MNPKGSEKLSKNVALDVIAQFLAAPINYLLLLDNESIITSLQVLTLYSKKATAEQKVTVFLVVGRLKYQVTSKVTL